MVGDGSYKSGKYTVAQVLVVTVLVVDPVELVVPVVHMNYTVVSCGSDSSHGEFQVLVVLVGIMH